MPPASQRTFDRLFAEGRQALLTGTQQPEPAPAEGGPRWGIAAVLRPDPAGAQALEQAAVTAADAADDHGWLAGATHRSHLSLRGGLEPYRSSVPAEDRLAARYVAALRTAASRARPLRFTVSGLTLTPLSIMACAHPDGTAAEDLAEAFGAALSAEGCERIGYTPSIWYVNLVYFTGPVRDAPALIEWVTARRHTGITEVSVTEAQLVRWRHTATGMTPVTLASATLPASPASGHSEDG